MVNPEHRGSPSDARDAIKRVAAELIASRGYHSMGLRNLASECGITLGTLYHYFPSKEDMLAELFDDAMMPLLATLGDVRSRLAEDPEDALRYMVESFITISLEELGSNVVLLADNELRALSEPRLQRALQQRDEYEKLMLSVVETGCAQGAFDVPNPKLAVFAVLAVCNSAPRWYKEGGELSAREVTVVNTELAMRLVGA